MVRRRSRRGACAVSASTKRRRQTTGGGLYDSASFSGAGCGCHRLVRDGASTCIGDQGSSPALDGRRAPGAPSVHQTPPSARDEASPLDAAAPTSASLPGAVPRPPPALLQGATSGAAGDALAAAFPASRSQQSAGRSPARAVGLPARAAFRRWSDSAHGRAEAPRRRCLRGPGCFSCAGLILVIRRGRHLWSVSIAPRQNLRLYIRRDQPGRGRKFTGCTGNAKTGDVVFAEAVRPVSHRRRSR